MIRMLILCKCDIFVHDIQAWSARVHHSQKQPNYDLICVIRFYSFKYVFETKNSSNITLVTPYFKNFLVLRTPTHISTTQFIILQHKHMSDHI